MQKLFDAQEFSESRGPYIRSFIYLLWLSCRYGHIQWTKMWHSSFQQRDCYCTSPSLLSFHLPLQFNRFKILEKKNICEDKMLKCDEILGLLQDGVHHHSILTTILGIGKNLCTGGSAIRAYYIYIYIYIYRQIDRQIDR